MEMKIELPFKIGQKVWIVRNAERWTHNKMLYIFDDDTLDYTPFREQGFSEKIWIKEAFYIKAYTIDEEEIKVEMCTHSDLCHDEDLNDMREFYIDDIYMYNTEEEANIIIEKLKNKEIVTCKDCKYKKDKNIKGHYTCEKHHRKVDEGYHFGDYNIEYFCGEGELIDESK